MTKRTAFLAHHLRAPLARGLIALIAGGCSGGTSVSDALLPLFDAVGELSDAAPSSDAAPNSDADAGASLRLRIMSANTSTGNNQSYDPGEGQRIFEGLHPDVTLIQEFNYGDNSDAAVSGFVTATFGSSFAYFRESGDLIPNGVISRYPILGSGSWTDPEVSNRGFVWAHIDLPGPIDLWAVSLHLLTTSASNRLAEATALVALIEANVPLSDYLVVGGDLNTDVRTEPCIATLTQVVATAAPWPADNLGNDNTSTNRDEPHDWVMPSANLRAVESGVAIGAQTFAHGLVVDSRVYTPLADIAPVQLGDSGAPNMQHMAVVEDFLIPIGD